MPHGRIKLGTESSGGFRHIVVANCIFEFCKGLALETVDGGALEDIAITNLVMCDIINAPIFMIAGGFYEDEGLINPVRRGRTRLFRPSDRRLLSFILRGKRLGFSIAEIREILVMYKEPPGEEGQLRLLVRRINEKRSELEQSAATSRKPCANWNRWKRRASPAWPSLASAPEPHTQRRTRLA